MTTSIDRVNFQERQYLRSFDYTAEQLYHMEMRRRMNLALHLWGIVDGLELLEGPKSPGLPDEFYVTPGMAIDGFGREIVLPWRHSLRSPDIIQRSRDIQQAGEYYVVIEYRRNLSTPPAPGYRLCKVEDQYTRWHETFEVRLVNLTPSPTPATLPGVADELSDDPVADPWPVILGVATVGGSPLAIQRVRLEVREYVGLRAQHIVAPVSTLSSMPDKTFPIRVSADLLAEKNLAVATPELIPPIGTFTPPLTPKTAGNLKINGDLFLSGDLYKDVGGGIWLNLQRYLQQFIPDVQTKPLKILPAPSSGGTNASTGQALVSFTTRLRNPSKAELSVTVLGWSFLGPRNAMDWLSDVLADNTAKTLPIQLLVEPQTPPASTALATGTQYDFTVNWTVGPTAPTVASKLHVTEIYLSCVAIFTP